MKEIDFLPEWYKSGKRKNASYRIQCVILGGIFTIMMVWNFFAAGSVSRAEAELTRIAAGNAEAQAATREFAKLKNRLGKLQKEAATIEKIDSRINLASVLAELSFLVDRRIVLGRVELTAEKFTDTLSGKGPKRSGALVRAVRTRSNEKAALPLGDVRFKVVIGGVAADAGDVAALICKLEDSPYFFQVVPLFSRNTRIQPKTKLSERSSDLQRGPNAIAEDIRVSEFEISCYLANYRQE